MKNMTHNGEMADYLRSTREILRKYGVIDDDILGKISRLDNIISDTDHRFIDGGAWHPAGAPSSIFTIDKVEIGLNRIFFHHKDIL